MALNVDDKVKTAQAKKAALENPNDDAKVELELALYNRYNRNGTHFEKGVVYKFSKKQAVELLGETDHGRSVWKMHRKPVPKVERTIAVDKDGAVDMSSVDLKKGNVQTPDTEVTPPTRIDVGNDEEIADLLGDLEDGEVVTV